jgi:hypothetical protein
MTIKTVIKNGKIVIKDKHITHRPKKSPCGQRVKKI